MKKELDSNVLRNFLSGSNLEFYLDIFKRRVGQPRYYGIESYFLDDKLLPLKKKYIHAGKLRIIETINNQGVRLTVWFMFQDGIFRQITMSSVNNIEVEGIFYFNGDIVLNGLINFNGLIIEQ